MAQPILSVLPDLRYSTYWLLVWCSAGITAFLYHARVRHEGGVARSAGLALMSVPVWMALWGFIDSISVLVDSGSVLRPISPRRLSRIYANGIVRDIGYLGIGFLLWTRHQGIPTGLRDLAARLRNEGLPMGQQAKEGTSVWHGYLLFPVLLVATVLFNLLLAGAQSLQNGDESRIWDNLTVYHVLMISLAAGFTEELVYRFFLLRVAQRVLSAFGAADRGALWGAVGIQAVVFGLAHSGYGTWSHILLPAAFGLVAGFIALRYGLWAAVVLHVLVDVYALGSEVATEAPWFVNLLLGALLLNVVATIVVGAQLLIRQLSLRRQQAS